MFADDLLVFCKGDENSVKGVKALLLKFFNALGLQANLGKSEVYFGGLDEEQQLSLAGILGIPIGKLPFRYLRVPLTSKKLTIAQCLPLVEKISVKHWSCKFLSYTTRITLIKIVLAGSKGFWARIFLLPKKVISKVEMICRSFLWSGSEVGNKKDFFFPGIQYALLWYVMA